MKKINFLFILLFLSVTGFSQANFDLGVKTGVNFSNTVNKSTMQAGFDLGLFMRIGSPFYFQPEVNYSLRSSTFKEAFEDEISSNFQMKTHNLDIPLLFGYKFANRENFNFRVFVGPRVGVTMGNNYNNKTDHETFNIMEFGGQCGIGIDFWRFMLDVKYDFSTKKYDPVSGTASWLGQNMINISLGFKIIK